MSGLASRILRGRIAATLAVNAELLGQHQGRLIVRLRQESTVGVFDQRRDELVLFDAGALVALASAESLVADEDAGEGHDFTGRMNYGRSPVIDPPSRL